MQIGNGSLMDFLRSVQDQHPGKDEDSVRTPLETETAPTKDNSITPDQAMRDRQMGSDSRNITDDAGNIVDMDWNGRGGGGSASSPYQTNPFAKALGALKSGGNGDGTLSGFISRLLGNTPERNNGGLTAPGTATPNDLNPTPSKDQPQSGLAPSVPLPRPRPKDYSMSGLQPQHLDELQTSLLHDSGQNTDPNSLAGRMSHPNAASDMGQQGAEAVNIADDIRGFNGRRNQALKKGKPHV